MWCGGEAPPVPRMRSIRVRVLQDVEAHPVRPMTIGRIVTWLSVGAMVAALVGSAFFRLAAKRATAERDAARVELKATRGDLAVAVAAAERCAAEFKDRDARCSEALTLAEANTARARRAARACQSDDAVRARLGEATR